MTRWPLPSSRRIGVFFSFAVGLASHLALAAPKQAVLLPTELNSAKGCSLSMAEPSPAVDPSVESIRNRVGELVTGALEDSGFAPQPPPITDAKGCTSELALLQMAKDKWVVLPQIAVEGESVLLRIVVAEPNSAQLHVMTRQVAAKDLEVRTIVMVSELLAPPSSHSGSLPAHFERSHAQSSASRDDATARSAGRGILTFTSGLLGGAVGYSLQRASGSNDLRLTYPLIALGTGIGVAASLIASDEWDVSTAEAWYLSAGMFWPAASGMLLARSYQIKPSTDRYIFGLGGAASGVVLASIAINSSEISEGDALVTHSGGAIGLLLGGLVDMTISGKTNYVPWHGMGYGSGIGVLLAGATATRLRLSPSRALFIDMAAGLGALGGAAAGSPLLLVENDFISAKRQRAWLSVVFGCAIIGGGLGWHLTRSMPDDVAPRSSQRTILPFANTLPPLDGLSGNAGRGMQLGVQGTF